MASDMVVVSLTTSHMLNLDVSSWSWPNVLPGPVTGMRTERLMSCPRAEICRTVCWSCPGTGPAAIQHTINLISSCHYIRINLINFYSHTVSLSHIAYHHSIQINTSKSSKLRSCHLMHLVSRMESFYSRMKT